MKQYVPMFEQFLWESEQGQTAEMKQNALNILNDLKNPISYFERFMKSTIQSLMPNDFKMIAAFSYFLTKMMEKNRLTIDQVIERAADFYKKKYASSAIKEQENLNDIEDNSIRKKIELFFLKNAPEDTKKNLKNTYVARETNKFIEFMKKYKPEEYVKITHLPQSEVDAIVKAIEDQYSNQYDISTKHLFELEENEIDQSTFTKIMNCFVAAILDGYFTTEHYIMNIMAKKLAENVTRLVIGALAVAGISVPLTRGKILVNRYNYSKIDLLLSYMGGMGGPIRRTYSGISKKGLDFYIKVWSGSTVGGWAILILLFGFPSIFILAQIFKDFFPGFFEDSEELKQKLKETGQKEKRPTGLRFLIYKNILHPVFGDPILKIPPKSDEWMHDLIKKYQKDEISSNENPKFLGDLCAFYDKKQGKKSDVSLFIENEIIKDMANLTMANVQKDVIGNEDPLSMSKMGTAQRRVPLSNSYIERSQKGSSGRLQGKELEKYNLIIQSMFGN